MSKVKGQRSNVSGGFTLMEMVVAVALFLIAVTICIGIFMSALKANGKIIAMQDVENEVRYIIEVISKEVRLGTIAYDYYEDNFENPVSILAIRDNAGNVSFFGLKGDGVSDGIVQVSLTGGETWSDLNTDSIRVDSFDFYLIPDYDPFSQTSEDIQQPMVLLYLDGRYDKDGTMDGQIKIQTAVVSRQYKK